MEGMIASWYARNTARSLDSYRDLAATLARDLPPGARVLEVAPGPGYLAIELARLGDFEITGLDISRSFVRIASENARRAGVRVDFRLGDAAALPFEAGVFDRIVCRAAFKNFSDPVGALREMHRVLAHGGVALIFDLRNDVSDEAVKAEVESLGLRGLEAFATRLIFKDLKRRAWPKAAFQRMAAETPFGCADVREVAIGLEVRLAKPAAGQAAA